MKFSKTTLSKLGFYVYALVDPRDMRIFYVGKGSSNNRAFSHLAEQRTEPEKNIRIAEIRNAGEEPIVDILRHGLETNEQVLDVEAAIIDAIGVENLTNQIRGHGTLRGRQTSQQVERLLGSTPVKIDSTMGRCMLFFIHMSYSPTMSESEIYDCTRQFWYKVSRHNREELSADGKLRFPIALAIVDSVVVRAYSIEAWFPAGSTLSSRTPSNTAERWEFVGQLIPDHRLLDNRLVSEDGKDIVPTQQGYSYVK